MKIAELFVDLGVKGDNAAQKALSQTKLGLKEIVSSSLEAKAALAAVIYGLERMMSASAKQGNALWEFSKFTGLSTKTLLQWQEAARQTGVSAEEMEQSFRSVQETMGKTMMGGGAPMGLAFVQRETGLRFDQLGDTKLVVEKVRQFLQTTKLPKTFANEVALSMGLTPGAITTAREFKGEIGKLKAAFSDSDIQKLHNIEVAWMKLWNSLKMISASVTLKFGQGIVGGLARDIKLITDLIGWISKLSKEFPKLATLAKVALAGIGVALLPLLGPFQLLAVAVSGILALLNQIQKWREGKENMFSDIYSFISGSSKKEAGQPKQKSMVGNLIDQFSDLIHLPKNMGVTEKTIAPSIKSSGEKGASNQNTSINTTVHNHGVKDMREGSDLVEKAVKHAFYSNSALLEVT